MRLPTVPPKHLTELTSVRPAILSRVSLGYERVRVLHSVAAQWLDVFR